MMHSPEQLRDIIIAALEKLNFPANPARLYDPVRYMLGIGGKRMRPVLALMSCEIFGKPATLALNAALGIEVFHNFTLLHDDIMDQAPLRRTSPTVHAKWNQSIAILAGDVMFVKACELINAVEPSKAMACMEVFLRTAGQVCEGQQMDMDFESAQSVNKEEYLEMIRLKTAVLLGGSLQLGALIADAPSSDANSLYQFGVNLGMAFQLQDDILDVYGDSEKFGKQTGGDILANKKTFLLITALEKAEGALRSELIRWINAASGTFNPHEKINAVKSVYNELEVAEDSGIQMQQFFDKAMSHLDAIGVKEEKKEPLRHLSSRLMVREV